MKYLIVIDSAANDRPTRSYLCRPRKYRRASWGWTDQRQQATEFASLKEVQHIIETKMKLKSGVRIVPVDEDSLAQRS